MAIIVSFGAIDADRKIPVTVNVQAFTLLNKPSVEISEDEIWSKFEHLRDLKNLAFESCISDKVREDFR